jgi:hypothetical protein
MVVVDCVFVFRPCCSGTAATCGFQLVGRRSRRGVAAGEIKGFVRPPFLVLFLFVKFNFNKTSKKYCLKDICVLISLNYLLVITWSYMIPL